MAKLHVNELDVDTDGRIYSPNCTTKTFRVDNERTDEYVEDGSYTRPFKTIPAAIATATSPAIILTEPGTYPEDITLKPGVHLRSRLGLQPCAIITGKVSWLSDAGLVMMNGMYVINDSDHAIDFGGTAKQKLWCHNSKFETNSPGAHHAINHSNTNIDSEIFLKDSMAQALITPGGAKPIETGALSQGLIGLDNSTVRITDDIDNIALNLRGAISYWHRMDQIKGRVVVADVASCNICLDGIYTENKPCFETNSMGLSILTNALLSTNTSPAVIGMGAFAYSQIGYAKAGIGLADTLNGGAGPTVGVIPAESLVLTSADGTKWKLAVDNAGTILTTEVP